MRSSTRGVLLVVYLASLRAVMEPMRAEAAPVEPQEPHFREGQHNPRYRHSDTDEDTCTLPDVECFVHRDPVVIFSKSYCPFCRRAKLLAKHLGMDATILELDQEPHGPEAQARLLELTGQRTVPHVFIQGIHFGGAMDFEHFNDQGRAIFVYKWPTEHPGLPIPRNVMEIPIPIDYQRPSAVHEKSGL